MRLSVLRDSTSSGGVISTPDLTVGYAAEVGEGGPLGTARRLEIAQVGNLRHGAPDGNVETFYTCCPPTEGGLTHAWTA